MRRFLSMVVLYACAAWAYSPQQGLPEHDFQLVDGYPVASDRIMIRLSSNALATDRSGSLQPDASTLSMMQERNAQGHRMLASETLPGNTGLERTLVLHFEQNVDVESELEWWSARPEVEAVELDWIHRIALSPNDTYYSQQWAHRNIGQYPGYGTNDCDIDSDQAWDISTGSNLVTIAIIDTGVDLNHPDLQSKIVAGYDYVNNDATADDDHMHGTACASIAAAHSNNGTGVTGVDWQARIMPLKALDSDGSGSTSDIISSVNWAVANGADVISMSLGGGSYSSNFNNAINAAVSAGVVVVAATGNDNAGSISYPALYSNCIAVGALSPCNERKTPSSCDGEYWWGSNYGTGLDIMAPGVKLRSATINSYISNMNGTSGATPHVAGVAGLIKSVNPTLSVPAIKTIMMDSAYDIGDIGYDTQTGHGRLNAYEALLLAIPQDPCDADLDGPVLDHVELADTFEAGPYLVEADATDPCGIDDMQLRWLNGGSWLSTEMLLSAGDTYAGHLPAAVVGSTVHYEILATDGSSNANQSTVSGSFVVLDPCLTDTEAPVISLPNPIADTENTEGPYFALFTATDPCGIASLDYVYRYDGGDWTIGLPVPAGESWLLEIPGHSAPAFVEYAITATDASPQSNWAFYPADFQILAPQTLDAPVIQIETQGGGELVLSWAVIDGATSYKIYQSMDGGLSYSFLQETVETQLFVMASVDQVQLFRVTAAN